MVILEKKLNINGRDDLYQILCDDKNELLVEGSDYQFFYFWEIERDIEEDGVFKYNYKFEFSGTLIKTKKIDLKSIETQLINYIQNNILFQYNTASSLERGANEICMQHIKAVFRDNKINQLL